MKYEHKLILRVAIALIILLLPINIFYTIFTKPTLSLAYFSFMKYSVIEGNSLIINERNLSFIPACIGASAYYLLALLILLTKDIRFKQGLYLFFLGIFLIFIMNIIRIDVLIIILLKFGVNWFDKLHVLFWEFFSSIYVALVWIFLIYKFKIKTIPAYSDILALIKKIKK